SDENDEILSSSTTGHLWKTAFGRRGAAQFLDVCLLKKAYMKALEDMSDDEQDLDAVSSIVNTLVDKIVVQINQQNDDDDDDDEVDLAERIGKRSLTRSTMNLGGDAQPIKRLRSNIANANVSV
ncbi:unnamed protein product, partial [Rotaria sp. Silwood2]